MRVERISSQITFTSEIKKLYKKGEIQLDYDIYNLPLTVDNVSDEHVIPKSKGGSSKASNIVLADKTMNSLRGNEPIENYVTMEMVNKYVERLLKNKPRTYNIVKYCNDILETFNKIFNKG